MWARITAGFAKGKCALERTAEEFKAVEWSGQAGIF